MIKYYFVIISVFLLAANTHSQNYHRTLDDDERIAITPHIGEESGIMGQARNILKTRMDNIINLNGLAAMDESSYFRMTPTVSVLSQDITTTAPPMHAVTLLVSFVVEDSYSGAVFGETSVEVKGVDRSEERAFTQALNSINPRSGQFKAFMERAKEQILSFYNTECDIVITTAQSLIEQERTHEAVRILTSVPTVARECYGLAMELAAEVGPVVRQEPMFKDLDENDDVEKVPASILRGRLRDLEVEIISVEFTGNDIDVTMNLKNEAEDYRVDLQSARFFDVNGNEYTRRIPYNQRFTELVRGEPAKQTFSFSDNNLDLVEILRVLELNFSSGTLRFENIPVAR